MRTVIFASEEAIFQFDREAVMECLEHRKSSYDVHELEDLIKAMADQPENGTLSIEEHRYFGFITLDLINASEGSVVCKNCGKQYRSNQLEAFTVGPSGAESSVKAAKAKNRGFKNPFRKKLKPPGIYGGKGYKCPRGHTLIFIITWRT